MDEIAELEKDKEEAPIVKKGRKYEKTAETEHFTLEEAIEEGDKKLEEEFDEYG